ncbi:MAG: DUF4236 domain-containing protein [Acidobacteria bacterium]|nr:DUF4236 domain-containing protein [Acidobacteriota bacterium]
MGWSLRKSFRLLPGIRLNLSKSGPRLSVGVPGARASIDIHGKTRVYAGKGPLRYQKAITVKRKPLGAMSGSGLLAALKRILG